jgi:hypothetical protein
VKACSNSRNLFEMSDGWNVRLEINYRVNSQKKKFVMA